MQPRRKKNEDFFYQKQSKSAYAMSDLIRESSKTKCGYKVAPANCEVSQDRQCDLIKTTYDVIAKYTKAIFDGESESFV